MTDRSISNEELAIILNNCVKTLEAQGTRIEVLLNASNESKMEHALVSKSVEDLKKGLSRVETLVILGNGKEPLKETTGRAMRLALENKASISSQGKKIEAAERRREDHKNKIVLAIITGIVTLVTAVVALFKSS